MRRTASKQQKREQHPVPFLSLTDVTIRLGERLVFKRTNWRIDADQHWAVVGPNGSGKSTLMRAICGELPVVAGRIEYHFARKRGTDAMDQDLAGHRAVAYVSLEAHRRLVSRAMSYHQARWSPIEEPDIPTALDVILENAPDASPRTSRRIARSLGIDHLLRRKVSHLSNGETRKVLIARALAQRPRLLILDDPFAGLDRQSRPVLRRILSELMTDRMRLILVTQRLDELPPGVTHLLYVEDDRVVAAGSRRSMMRQGIGRRLDRAGKRRLPQVTSRTHRPRKPRQKTAKPLVRIRHARVAYDKTVILDGIDWTIGAGEHWALLGPNGSGKTTLLSLILGDNPQVYANDVEIFGKPLGPEQSLWDVKRRIGWLSPELQFHYPGEATCRQVVSSGHFHSVGLYQQPTPSQDRATRQWMRSLDLTDLADVPLARLSDGQQRMALLARAMVKQPPLVILDEPCQGLDPAHRKVVLRVVDLIARRADTTLIYVTHHPKEMPRCITRMLRLRCGRGRS
ncbi:MAG: ATP-binding cassette domain-containing protein [Phycisphaerae bacterium]|nr:ATP-binding cassette domain-containing protein [Phycisphaerae bacterium]